MTGTRVRTDAHSTLIAALLCVLLLAPAGVAQSTDTPQAPTATQPTTDAPPVEPEKAAPSPTTPTTPPSAQQPTTAPPPPVVLRLPAQVHVAVDAMPPPPEPPKYSWIEKWSWRFSFIAMGLAALLFGFRDSRSAVYLESQTTEARYQRDLIRQGDLQAEGVLEDIVEEVGEKTKTYDRSPGPAIYSVMGGAGAAWLLFLALLPDLGVVELKSWRDAAWDTLNSEFATAFVGTWIALLFFAGSQSQRRREARQNYGIVTNEGERIAADQKARDYEKYAQRFEAVSTFRGDVPPAGPTIVAADGSAQPDETKLRKVEAEAIRLALQTKLEAGDQGIRSETDRLKALMTPPRSERLTLGKFIQNAIDDGSIKDPGGDWKAIADAYSISARVIWEKIEKLSDKLPPPVAN